MPQDYAATEGHRRAIERLGEDVVFVRATGVAPNVKTTEIPARAIVRDYSPAGEVMPVKREGGITQGARHLIVMQDDLERYGFPVPLQKNDRVKVRGDLMNITSVDASKRQFGGATELVAVGVP